MMNKFYIIILLVILGGYGCRNSSTNKPQSQYVQPFITEDRDSTFYDILVQNDTIIGNFRAKYHLTLNDIIADTINISSKEGQMVRNRSIFLTVYYKEQQILDCKEIKSTSFDGIQEPSKFIFSPTCWIGLESINDTLVVSSGMFVDDTDWGYFINIKVAPDGEILLVARDADDSNTIIETVILK